MIFKSDIEQSIVNLLYGTFPEVDITTENIYQNLDDRFFFIDVIELSPTTVLNDIEVDREFLINIKYWDKKNNYRGGYNNISDIFMTDLFSRDLKIIPYLSDEEIEKENPLLREGEMILTEIIYNQEFDIIDNYLNFTFSISFTDSAKDKKHKYDILDNLEGKYIRG